MRGGQGWESEIVEAGPVARVTARRVRESGVVHDVQLIPGPGTHWLAVDRAMRDVMPAGAAVTSTFVVEAGEADPTVQLRWRESLEGEVHVEHIAVTARSERAAS